MQSQSISLDDLEAAGLQFDLGRGYGMRFGGGPDSPYKWKFWPNNSAYLEAPVAEIVAAKGGGGKGLPMIDGKTAPWSHEYITEKAFEILTDPRVGIVADLADWMRFTKGAGNAYSLITVASDFYQRFYKQSIDNMIFGYRLTTTGLATWVGYSTGPIGGITVGLYSTGIEEAARAGAKLEIQMRNFFNPTTKGSFWSKLYW